MKGPAPTPRNQFSFSRLKTFQQCPLRYRYRYLKGMRDTFRSIESFLGTTVHEVLEWLYGEHATTSTPDLPAVLDEFARRWEASWSDDVAVIRVSDSADDSYRLGREMLTRFFRDTFARDSSQTIALEQRFSVRLSPNLVFTGIADRVGRTEGGRLFIVDYKTSSRKGTPSEFSEGLQAPLYASCVLRTHDEDEAMAGYHYLRHGSTSWHRVNRTRAEDLLRRFADLAATASEATEFPAQPGVLCAWCGFNAICPSAQVSPALSGGQRMAEDMLLPGTTQAHDG